MVTTGLSAGTQGDTCDPCATTHLGTEANALTSSLSDTDAVPHAGAGCHDLSDPGAGDHGRTNTDATGAICHTGTACHFRPGASSGSRCTAATSRPLCTTRTTPCATQRPSAGASATRSWAGA